MVHMDILVIENGFDMAYGLSTIPLYSFTRDRNVNKI